ncbi:hypothetical protein [Streptomyces scopuliridis]|uniref:hypothetical protein n=1 Tax=Streptomyces scopuliridis TaxID=452529 RepID=UPI0036C19954
MTNKMTVPTLRVEGLSFVPSRARFLFPAAAGEKDQGNTSSGDTPASTVDQF